MRSLVMSRKKTPGNLAEIDLFFLWLQKRLVKPWIAFWLQDWKLRMNHFGYALDFCWQLLPQGETQISITPWILKIVRFWVTCAVGVAAQMDICAYCLNSLSPEKKCCYFLCDHGWTTKFGSWGWIKPWSWPQHLTENKTLKAKYWFNCNTS